MTFGLRIDEQLSGDILFRIQMAAVMNPAPKLRAPKLGSTYKQDQYKPKLSLVPPLTAPDLSFIGRVVEAEMPAQTFGALNGVLRPYAGQRLASFPTAAPKQPAVSSVFGSVGSWLYTRAAGLYDSVVGSRPFATNHDDPFLANRQSRSVSVARAELAAGVRESGKNRGRRIDLYSRTALMSPGGAWCGFFVGYAYSKNGFKSPERLASIIKARLFFLYRGLSSADSNLRTHQAQGQTRQFFMLAESPSRAFVRSHASLFPQYDADAHTFSWRNLPVRAGDTILFERGATAKSPGTHMGIVDSYDPISGRLTTIEGNVDNKVVRKTYDLTNAAIRKTISGFGRPAPGDFA